MQDAVDDAVCSTDGRPDRGNRGRGRAGSRSGPASKYYSGDSAAVSRLLDSLLRGYDQRLRPNYNGQLNGANCEQSS